MIPEDTLCEDWTGWWELSARRQWDKFLSFQGVEGDAAEAATKTVDRHKYNMTKGTFSMVHSIPAKNFTLSYSAPIDDQWHECPYPKPTAKLYGAGHSKEGDKTQWRHRWLDFPLKFETEIRQFIEGKNTVLRRSITPAGEMNFEVFVLETEGMDQSKILVGPCSSTFRKDGCLVADVKMSSSKGERFYRQTARAVLVGCPVVKGAWQRPLPRVRLQALGNTISMAAGVAAALEREGVGIIGKTLTSQVDVDGRGVPKISIIVAAKSRGVLPHIVVRPFSVLGSQMTQTKTFVASAGPAPGPETAIVDPAGLPYISELGPAGASGAAGVIYEWLGIRTDAAFPQPVREAITAPLDAKSHAYGTKKCIHVVGPDFRNRQLARADAVNELSRAYHGIFAEFVASGWCSLRLLPVSGGIFAGDFAEDLPEMTPEAVAKGYSMLSEDQQRKVLLAGSLEMCIFMGVEFDGFAQAFATQSSR